MKRLKHISLVFIGSLALLVGVIGIVLPILPTTPFLLLAAFCYVRSSKRLYVWLLENRMFGPYIHSYLKHRAVSPSAKRWALLLLWAGILFTLRWLDQAWLQGGLLIVAALVSLYLKYEYVNA